MRTPILVEADTATDNDHPDASPSLEAAFFRKVVVRSSLVCGSTIFCCPKLTPFFLCARACACACAFHAIKGGITAGGQSYDHKNQSTTNAKNDAPRESRTSTERRCGAESDRRTIVSLPTILCQAIVLPGVVSNCGRLWRLLRLLTRNGGCAHSPQHVREDEIRPGPAAHSGVYVWSGAGTCAHVYGERV